MCNLKTLFIFALGAAVGSVVSWKLTKTKYEQIAQEEIESVKEHFTVPGSSRAIGESVPEEEPDNPEESDMEPYKNLMIKLGYEPEKEEESVVIKPYVISPDEFGEEDDYETISLTYYSDGILTDDMNERIDNVDDVVGKDSLTHFGEYEDDSVFVRNERLKCDYEILLDMRKYSEVQPNSIADEGDE